YSTDLQAQQILQMPLFIKEIFLPSPFAQAEVQDQGVVLWIFLGDFNMIRGQIKWAMLGDAGTKFFHANATSKHRHNSILSLSCDNGMKASMHGPLNTFLFWRLEMTQPNLKEDIAS
ncbi:hypothetical protein ACJX0J_005549, partial [Zea mays]